MLSVMLSVCSCKTVGNVLNEINMLEKKKKSGACNKRLWKTKQKEVAKSHAKTTSVF